MGLILVHQPVATLLAAYLVIIYFLVFVLRRQCLGRVGRRVVPAVEETVAKPRNARKFCPLDLVGQLCFRPDLDHVDLPPVRTAARDAVRQVLSVFRESAAGVPKYESTWSSFWAFGYSSGCAHREAAEQNRAKKKILILFIDSST